MSDEREDFGVEYDERPPDPAQARAKVAVAELFEERREEVLFSRQVEVGLEGPFIHWVTNRAVRELEAEGELRSEWRELESGGTVKLLWHRSFRYYKRAATDVVALVNRYSAPNIGGALGLHGEAMVLEGFASRQFVMKGREVREHEGVQWTETGHDLDFVFEREGVGYGVEVKNTLGYPDHDEVVTKTRLSKALGLKPVIVARMLPKPWVHELNQAGGFGLILKHQLYPWTHKELAKEVRETLGLPVDAPRRLHEVTMDRFETWHRRNV